MPRWWRGLGKVKVVLIRRSGESWRSPKVTAYSNEDALQSLVATSPQLLPGGAAALAVAREFPVAAGSIDLVGVDPDGEVVVCECKLEANREARRMVVGQLFAYAGALWELSFDDFSERFASQAKATLTEAVAKMATADWDEEQFRQRVEANLAAGRFG